MRAAGIGTKHRYAELDALRIIAALMVVFYHYCALGPATGRLAFAYPSIVPLAKYGYLGVDIFFIISGFVIALSAEGRSCRGFTAARARRLYPAFIAACLLTATVIAIVPDGQPHMGFGRLAANLTLFAPYFGLRSVDGVYWSLYVEIRFYILIALIVLSGLLNRIVILMALWLALSAVNLFVPLPYGSGGFLLAYAPLFVAGVIYSKIGRRAFEPWHAPVLLGAVVLSLAYAVEKAATVAAGTSLPLTPSVVCLILLSGHASVLVVSIARLKTQSIAFLPFLGFLSYPLYLTHYEIGMRLLPRFNAMLGGAPALVATIAVVAAIAAAIHLIVERRFQRLFSKQGQALVPAALGARSL